MFKIYKLIKKINDHIALHNKELQKDKFRENLRKKCDPNSGLKK